MGADGRQQVMEELEGGVRGRDARVLGQVTPTGATGHAPVFHEPPSVVRARRLEKALNVLVESVVCARVSRVVTPGEGKDGHRTLPLVVGASSELAHFFGLQLAIAAQQLANSLLV